MPAFVEFLLVAVALFLWESTLWLPLRSMALRKQWIGGRWKVLDPAALIATRELGLIPMLPFPPDLGLAPCQVPPLMVDANGRMMVENVPGRVFYINSLSWNDLREEPHHLAIAGSRIRVSSHRCVGVLKRARQRGATLDAAIRLAWRLQAMAHVTVRAAMGCFCCKSSVARTAGAWNCEGLPPQVPELTASRSSFSSHTTNIATSAGVMPGMRPAWPRVAGRISVNRTCASFFKPRIVE
jgi:hypothetical protein